MTTREHLKLFTRSRVLRRIAQSFEVLQRACVESIFVSHVVVVIIGSRGETVRWFVLIAIVFVVVVMVLQIVKLARPVSLEDA